MTRFAAFYKSQPFLAGFSIHPQDCLINSVNEIKWVSALLHHPYTFHYPTVARYH